MLTKETCMEGWISGSGCCVSHDVEPAP